MPALSIKKPRAPLASQNLEERPGFSMDEAIPYLVGHTISEIERELILHTLLRHRGNRTHAAKILGISIRCLRDKCREYKVLGITVPESRQPRVLSTPMSASNSTMCGTSTDGRDQAVRLALAVPLTTPALAPTGGGAVIESNEAASP
jgi:hypothetical protein